MTRRHLHVAARTGLLLAGLAGLGACASAPTHFFTLDPVAPAQQGASAYAGPPLKLMAVNIPPSLDRSELVSEIAPGEVKVHDFEHWEAPLGQTARQVLIQDLAARLPAGKVLGPAAPTGPHVATLNVDVLSFQAGPQGGEMQASWSASLAGAGAPLVVRSPIQQLQAPAAASTGGELTAQAFSRLLGQLADQIALDLPVRMDAAMAVQAAGEAQARMQTQTRTTTQTRQTKTIHSF